MTTAVKEKKPFLPQRKVPAQAPGAGVVAVRGASVGRAPVAAPLAIGGEPRVHLLPTEVVERQNFKLVKRRLLIAGVMVLVVVIAGYLLATVSLSSVQSQLSAAQATNAQVIAQQGQYSSVTKVNNDINSIQQSQKTATTQEIMWAPYLLLVENTLPAGAQITSFSGRVDSPLGTVSSAPSSTTATAPLEGPRVATVQLIVSMNQTDIPGWLVTLQKLKGYVDATPNTVAASTGAPGLYTVNVTLHVSSAAVSTQFTKTTSTGGTK